MADTDDTDPQPELTMVEAMGLTTLEEQGVPPAALEVALKWRRRVRAFLTHPSEPPLQEEL